MEDRMKLGSLMRKGVPIRPLNLGGADIRTGGKLPGPDEGVVTAVTKEPVAGAESSSPPALSEVGIHVKREGRDYLEHLSRWDDGPTADQVVTALQGCVGKPVSSLWDVDV